MRNNFWFFLLDRLFRISIFIDKKEAKIVNDEERRIKSVYFGVLSIVFVILSLGLCYPMAYLGVWLIEKAFTTFLGVFTYALGIGNLLIFAGGFFCFLVPFIIAVDAIKFVVAQRRVNRKTIGLVMLIISIITLVALLVLQVLAIVFVISK